MTSKIALALLITTPVLMFLMARGFLESMKGLELGETLPCAELQLLNGQREQTATWLGKPVLLILFHAACLACRTEIQKLSTLRRQNPALAGVSIILLSLDTSEEARVFQKQFDISFPILTDTRGEFLKRTRRLSVPTIYYFNPQGQLAYRHIGPTREGDIDLLLRQILSGSLENKSAPVAPLGGDRTYPGFDGILLQKTWYDCGDTALLMIFDHFAVPATYDEIHKELRATPGGVTMQSLKDLAHRKGLLCEGWRIGPADLPSIPLPALVFIFKRHYAVLSEITDDGEVLLLDPARGRVQISARRFQRIWTGETLLFQKPGRAPNRWFGISNPSQKRS